MVALPKWVWIVVLLAVALGAWLVFGNKKAAETTGAVTVSISQITSHPVFDVIIEGVKEGFAEAGYVEGSTVTFEIENAQGDMTANAAIAQQLSNGNHDILMPLGTQSSQALVNLVKDRPIVFGAVTDPVSAGLVVSNEAPGANVTGTSDVTLYREQLELLKKLAPAAVNIGVVYNPGEANSRFALAETERHAKDLGLTIVTAPANNSGEILAAARSLASRVDAFYLIPDNTVISGQEALISVALEAKKPLISIDESGVEKGALATLGTNYRELGKRTAEIAIRVLLGEDPGTIPVLGVTDADIFVNTTTAAAIGIEIPRDVLTSAKQVYE